MPHVESEVASTKTLLQTKFGKRKITDRDLWKYQTQLLLSSKRTDDLKKILQNGAIYWAGELIRRKKFVLLDGMNINRDSRYHLIDLLSESSNIDLLEVPKTAIFLDTSKKVCLSRYQKKPFKYMSSILSRGSVKSMYRMSEIPKANELPNLEVIVVSNRSDYNNAISHLNSVAR